MREETAWREGALRTDQAVHTVCSNQEALARAEGSLWAEPPPWVRYLPLQLIP